MAMEGRGSGTCGRGIGKDRLPPNDECKVDAPEQLERGFTVRDGQYLSARWPGDAHRFAVEFWGMVIEG